MNSRDMRSLLSERLVEEGMPTEVPISVAELHRRLLPYPLCRDRLGLVSKAEYDIGLLELLVDERALHVPEVALLEATRKELEAPEPGLALLQRFAASEVRLRKPKGEREEAGSGASPTVAAGPEPAAGGEPEPGPPVAAHETGRSRGDYLPGLDDPALVPRDTASVAPRGRIAGGGVTGAADTGGPCRSCAQPLPAREGLRYCPRCGADQERWPCPSCDAEVERGWSYCAMCGTMLPA